MIFCVSDRSINIPYRLREEIIELVKHHYFFNKPRLSTVTNILARIPSVLNAHLLETSSNDLLTDAGDYRLAEFGDGDDSKNDGRADTDRSRIEGSSTFFSHNMIYDSF